jgi:hypothetical protein
MAANGSDPSSRCDDAQFARALLECGRASLDSPDLLEPSDLIDRVTVVAERLSDHALIEAARGGLCHLEQGTRIGRPWSMNATEETEYRDDYLPRDG